MIPHELQARGILAGYGARVPDDAGGPGPQQSPMDPGLEPGEPRGGAASCCFPEARRAFRDRSASGP